MKFPPKFIFLVQQRVEGAKFSICFNGTLKGWFRSTRGVRQGESMSSYLFLMVLEVFNGLMQKLHGNNKFSFHPYCQDLRIKHLSFADDMILLSSAMLNSFRVI
ncbi:hypothetical protein LIER_17452 [Lithospermum erythrorhizon]|uniref:Reverse transcriptase domain-containing protein n=1 Tax=Lithospermum erythrorhizon TaxID=34254 RepID=A0AAV3QCR1_LITER